MSEPNRKPYYPKGYTKPEAAGDRLRTMTGVVIGGAIERTPAHIGAPASNEPVFDDDHGSPTMHLLAAIAGICGLLLCIGGAAGGLGLLGSAVKRVVEGWAFHVQHNLSFGAGLDELLRTFRDEPVLGLICGGALILIVVTLVSSSAVDAFMRDDQSGHNDRDD